MPTYNEWARISLRAHYPLAAVLVLVVALILIVVLVLVLAVVLVLVVILVLILVLVIHRNFLRILYLRLLPQNYLAPKIKLYPSPGK